MTKQGKIWGTTQLVVSNPSFEFHRIEYKRNSCCSIHKHYTKFNGFFVESGRMMVEVWPGLPIRHDGHVCTRACTADTPDKTFLSAGDFYQVDPGYYHRFTGIEDGVAFELYWSEWNPDDIERLDTGTRWEETDPARSESNPYNDLNHDGN